MEPLASKIRPKTLEHFVGQEHLVGVGKPLRKAIEEKHLFSFILWGPPGVGKTTLARIYAHALDARLYELSAVSAGKDDIKKIIGEPDTLLEQRPKLLFLDEIHRFNKAQQDFLLPYVESGKLVLIGATTENPSFEVIPALLSRCRVFVLEALKEKDLESIIKRTKIKVPKDAAEWLVSLSNGDARIALTALENTRDLYGAISIENLKNAFERAFIRLTRRAMSTTTPSAHS
jgi:putative ATPase